MIEGYNAETRPLFLKYDIDDEGTIQNAYACVKFDFIDEPVCIQGGNPEYYSANETILEGLKPMFESNSGSCGSMCSAGNFYVRPESSGFVYAGSYGSNAICGVNALGAYGGYVGVASCD